MACAWHVFMLHDEEDEKQCKRERRMMRGCLVIAWHVHAAACMSSHSDKNRNCPLYAEPQQLLHGREVPGLLQHVSLATIWVTRSGLGTNLIMVLFSLPACSTTVFSHSQTVVLCGSCSAVLCTPTGGRARLTEGR